MRIELERVSLGYGELRLLTNVSWSVEAPSMTAILGPSGSGKTTLLSAIAGEIQPSEGQLRFFKDEREAKPTVSWIFQSSPLLARRTALENVMLGALARGFSLSASHEMATAAMRQVAIGHLENMQGRVLSGGERQRVSIARGLAAAADVLLVDEPTASLDTLSRDTVCDALHRARHSSQLILVATHDPHVARVCDGRVEVQSADLVSI